MHFCVIFFLSDQSKYLLFSQLHAESVGDTMVVVTTILVSHNRRKAACVRLWTTEPARYMALGAHTFVLKTHIFELTFFAVSFLGFFRRLPHRVSLNYDCFRTVTDRSALNTFFFDLISRFMADSAQVVLFQIQTRSEGAFALDQKTQSMA